MSSSENEVNLTLQIQSISDDFDADELNRLTYSLMRSLEDVGVESVTVIREQDIPSGAKGDLITWGGLLVEILPTALPKVVEFLQAWMLRNKDQMMKAQFHLKDASGVERSLDVEYPANMPSEKLKQQMEVIKSLIEP